MSETPIAELPRLNLKNLAMTESFLPGQCDPGNISYPGLGAHGLTQIEEQHFWFTTRRRLILKLLKNELRSGASGLDIGCGSGFNANWLSDMGYPTLGVDAHKIVRTKSQNSLGFLQGDIFSLEPVPEFDFLILLDVIEHIEDDKKFLLHAMKFLKPGGIAILTTPALMVLWSDVDKISGHFRRYSKKTMRELVFSANSEILRQFYFYGSILPLYILSRIMTRLRPSEKVSNTESLPPRALNLIFKCLLNLEGRLTNFAGLPFGSSLFTVIRRHK